ncbi:MAG: SpoIIE family protein phosphatase [Spirochaetes bacterium]|nr:SpoIIE family protein phosphatase [Spirochaetota bacterium]
MARKGSGIIIPDPRWDSLLDGAGIALYLLDPEGRIAWIGSAIEGITRHRRDNLLGRPFRELLFMEEGAGDGVPAPSEAGKPGTRKCMLIGADSVPVSCNEISLKIDGGWSAGVIIPARALDRESREKIRMFTMAVDQSPATVVITDRNGSIEFVNPKFTSLTGYAFNEVMGHNPRILKSGRQDSDFYRDLWATISSGREWRGEFHNLKKNGESYWESASISPILNDGGEITHYVAVKEDITERKAAEEALRASEGRLRERNEEMEREMQYAKAIVGQLLPEAPPAHERLKVDFRFLPLEAIGGDYFSFNALQDGGLGVCIGDVAGHGVSAALFLALLRSMIERLSTSRGASPGEMIAGLSREVREAGTVVFLTALYGCFDFSGESAFRFSKAGHPPPVYYPRGTGEPVALWTSGMPLGLVKDAAFEESRITLKPGERVYLYTDGIIEARRRAGEMLDVEGLLAIVGSTGVMDLGESLDMIVAEVCRYRGAGRPEDDMVIIGFEVR